MAYVYPDEESRQIFTPNEENNESSYSFWVLCKLIHRQIMTEIKVNYKF